MAGDVRLTWRELSEEDLETCLTVQPRALGDAIVGRKKAIEVWRSLLRNPGFAARLIEDEGPRKSRRIAGFGASVFVAPEFLEAEMANPRPCLTSRIIAGLAAGAPVVLTRNEIARANGGDGLDAVFLSFVCGPLQLPSSLPK